MISLSSQKVEDRAFELRENAGKAAELGAVLITSLRVHSRATAVVTRRALRDMRFRVPWSKRRILERPLPFGHLLSP